MKMLLLLAAPPTTTQANKRMCAAVKKEDTTKCAVPRAVRMTGPATFRQSHLLCCWILSFLCLASHVSSFSVAVSNIRNVAPKQLSTGLNRFHANFQLDMSSSDPETAAMSIEQVSDDLKATQSEFEAKLKAAETLADIEELRRVYLTKKGPVNAAMKYMRDLSNEDKPRLGLVVNEVKDVMENLLDERKEVIEIEVMTKRMEDEAIDVTLPGTSYSPDIGRRHPLSMTMEKAIDIFVNLGYDTVTSCEESPEIETDYNCFEALNCPKDHPARDMQDTFYLTEDMEYMLRTHTSAVQIRQLQKRKPPLRIVAPGRVYRKDDIDATHSLVFHQVEILALEERGNLNLGHLKGTVEHFLKEMLGPAIELRFRGSYFPFTEPSMEVDVFFGGRWLEILGCGMVDPNVLIKAGIDPEKYSGFAAGFGVERFAMVIHEINDLREFYKNDKRFLQQFPYFHDDGMESFLNGEKQEPAVDPRGPDIPSPFVETVEELLAQRAAKETSKSDNNKPTKKSQQPTADAIDISKLDIRVGVISKAWEHEEADKLFCEEIDIGEESPRQIASGLRAHYSVDDLPGKRVLVLANLKARKMMGFPSHGMVLCACNSEGAVQFVEPPEGAEIGERIMVEGYDGEPATENQVIKKKMLDAIFPDLKTNDDGVPCYKGVPLSTSAGNCKPSFPGSDIS